MLPCHAVYVTGLNRFVYKSPMPIMHKIAIDSSITLVVRGHYGMNDFNVLQGLHAPMESRCLITTLASGTWVS